MRRQSRLAILAILACFALFVACGEAADPEQSEPVDPSPTPASTPVSVASPTPTPASDTTILNDTWWLLTAIKGETGQHLFHATIGFADGMVIGSGGCNDFATPYATGSDGSLEMPAIVATDIHCHEPNNIMQIDGDFFALLDDATHYETAGDLLTLSNESREALLTFGIDEYIEIENTSWSPVTFNGEPVSEDINIHMSFHYRLQVATPCLMTFLTYRSNNVDMMSISEIDIADEFCNTGDRLINYSENFLDALLDITSMRRVDRNHIELSSDDDAVTIVLEDTSWTHPVGLLLGTGWVLEELGGAPHAGDVLTAIMFDHNWTTGITGCLQGFPSAEFSSDGTLTPYAKATYFDQRCGADGPEPETQPVIEAAAGSTHYVRSPGLLELLDSNGQTTLAFRQVPRSTDLDGTAWTPVLIDGQPPIDGVNISLQFSGGGFGGAIDCNGYGGEFMVATPGRILLSPASMTSALCEETISGQNNQREHYMTLFGSITAYEVTENALRLIDYQGNTRIEFQPVSQRHGLDDTHWSLTEMNGEPVREDAGTTLVIGSDGAGGWSSCNNYYLQDVQIERDSFAFSDLGTEEQDCDPDLPEAEYYATLASISEYRLTGSKLLLRNAEGDTVLIFELASGEAELLDTAWSLVSMSGEQLAEEADITFMFPAGEIVAESLCMRYRFQGVGFNGSRITITGPIAIGMQECDEPPETFVSHDPPELGNVIASIAAYRLNDSTLELLNHAGHVVLLLERNVD